MCGLVATVMVKRHAVVRSGEQSRAGGAGDAIEGGMRALELGRGERDRRQYIIIIITIIYRKKTYTLNDGDELRSVQYLYARHAYIYPLRINQREHTYINQGEHHLYTHERARARYLHAYIREGESASKKKKVAVTMFLYGFGVQ